MDIFDIENYEKIPPHQRSLVDLVESISGRCSKDIIAADKVCTVRLNYDTYPQVKAIVDLSGNSLNTVVNELLTVALAAVISNMEGEALDTFIAAAEPIKKQMLEAK
jgi:hypothetical protein